ncbi:MAG TPA: extracellular solute-binding protein, partial [Kiloniellaceae bacterium]|nr:extracellular solute-binding protein [Kiloniellaceae bacterium]
RAFAKLESIRDDIVWWNSTTQAIQNLTAGDVVMTDQYNARITNEIENEGKNLAIVWDAGFFYGTDYWAVVAGAPQEKAALDLIKWFSVPEHQAGFSKLYSYGTGRKDAADFIPASQLANLPSSPEHAKFAAEYDNDFWVENKESLEARFKAWLEQ